VCPVITAIMLCASETWTLDTIESLYSETGGLPYDEPILGIFWYEFVTNVEVATLSQLPSINKARSRRRHSLFGHVRRIPCSCPPSPTSLSHVTTGLKTVWHLEETTRSSAKMMGGAGHHEHRALSFWCLECCDGSVSMEGATNRRRSSVERARQCVCVCSFSNEV